MTQFSDETKQKIVELCKKNKVPELCLFGSRSRGDHRPDSDYDLLVKFLPDPGISFTVFENADRPFRPSSLQGGSR